MAEISGSRSHHSKRPCHRRRTLARLNQPDRLLLELKRVTPSLRLRHLSFPFAVEQLAKGYVWRGQGHIAELNLRDFLLVGGSLGGLVALLFAERNPDLITGFVNVEGNLTPEDCLFSRKVIPHSFSEFEKVVFPQIKGRLAQQQGEGFAKHLDVLEGAESRSYYAYSFQTVAYSDSDTLMNRFLNLPIPIFFFYGSENRNLSYLPELRKSRCKVVEFDNADRFLFYDTPPRQYALELQRCAIECYGAKHS